jgi:hypothetical protein
MARPRVADGGNGLQTCRVAANKLSWTAEKVWSYKLEFGRGAKNSSPTGPRSWRDLVKTVMNLRVP